ncbi:hypothetical protein BGZ54_003852, partial [Gamsiella multidivaricata]
MAQPYQQIPLPMQMQMQMQHQQLYQQQPQQPGYAQLPGQNLVNNFTPQSFQPSPHTYQPFQQQSVQSGPNAVPGVSNPQGMAGLGLVGTAFNLQPPPPATKKDIWAAQQANLQAQLNKNNLNAGMIAEGNLDVASRKEKLQQMFQHQQPTQSPTHGSTAGSAGLTPSRATADGTSTTPPSTGEGNGATLSVNVSPASASGAVSSSIAPTAMPLASTTTSAIVTTTPVPNINSPLTIINNPADSMNAPVTSTEAWIGRPDITSPAPNAAASGFQSSVGPIANARLQK